MRRAFLLFFLLLSITLTGLAQTSSTTQTSPSPAEQKDDGVIKVDTSLVNFPILASDKSGRYIANLRAEDFNIYENGVKQQIDLFATNTVPFKVLLLVDLSGSINGNFTAIQEAARAFIANIREQDEVMITSFADTITVHSNFTSDKAKLYNSIATMSPGGSTCLYDAIYQSSKDVLKKIQGRKAVILLTDGFDTFSRATHKEAINELVESGALVYVVSYPTINPQLVDNPPRRHIFDAPMPLAPNRIEEDRNSHPDNSLQMPGHHPPLTGTKEPQSPFTPHRLPTDKFSTFKPIAYTPAVEIYADFLNDLLKKTDGIEVRCNSIDNLADPMRSVAEQLRNIYTIGYYPNNPVEKGGLRKIEVKLINNHKGVLRYKRGYDARALARPILTSY